MWKPEEFRAYQEDRAGALIHQNLAKTYGWKVGDVIPITVPWLARPTARRSGEFTVRGIFRYKDPEESPRQILFHYEYLDESRVEARHRGIHRRDHRPGLDPAPFAVKVDELFMNSAAETSSGTQDALRRDYFQRIGNVSLIAYLHPRRCVRLRCCW